MRRLIVSLFVLTAVSFATVTFDHYSCDIESFSQSLSETPFSTNGAIEMRGESAAAIDNNSVLISYVDYSEEEYRQEYII